MNATEKILSVYDKETLKEIAAHGCQSGVCSPHIYYGDTIKFFDTYEDEIVEYLEDDYGTEFLVNMFRDADAYLTTYKNSVCWAFIEMVAMRAVDEYDDQEQAEEATIAGYMVSLA